MEEDNAHIRVGTSGYSFVDWKGPFYPGRIDKSKMLDHYVQYFPTVEINSTYYRIPHPSVMDKIAAKVPDGFDFMVKVPKSFTHTRHAMSDDIRPFAEAVAPMVDSGKLSGLLAQFPYAFKFSDQSLDHIARCRDAVAPHPLFVEFRHDGWVNRRMYDRLRAEQVGYVCVDEPELKGLLKPDAFTTTDIGYVRLHGRNAEKWWNGGDLRYDYSYSEEQLGEWKDKIRKLLKKSRRVYVFFNNCHKGQAAANALDFQNMIQTQSGSE